MSLKDIKENFEKIRAKGENYFEIDNKRQAIENEIKNLKNQYKEKGVGKEVFSEKNKNLILLENEMKKIREEIAKINKDISKDIQKEMQDAIGWNQ